MYAILDIESTGGNYDEEGIMEIAIYRFDGHTVVDKFSGLINPEREIQPFVTKLTGIDASLLQGAPRFCDVAQRIVEITKGATLVAHNAQFDYRILRTEFRRLGYTYQRKTLCTVTLSQKLLPDASSHSLGKLVRSLGISVSHRHRAHGDALATLELFTLLLTKDPDKNAITQTIRAEAHGELSPKQLKMVAALPPEAGVYALHNKEGKLLFLGSAENLTQKVNKHLISGNPLARTLQKEAKKVTYEKTGSALVAHLKAYQERKKKKPKYNAISNTPNFSPNNTDHSVLHGTQNNGQEQRSIEGKGIALAQRALQKTGTESTPYLSKLALDSPSFQTPTEAKERNPKLNIDSNEKALRTFTEYSTAGKRVVLLDRGRKSGEHSFVLLKNGTLQGFGYRACNTPMHHITPWEKAMTPMVGDANTACIITSQLRKSNTIKIVALTSDF